MAIEIPFWLVSIAVSIARLVPWKRAIPGRNSLPIVVRDIRAKKFKDKDGAVGYTMLQVWVANGSCIDAQKVRATVNWKRHGGGRCTDIGPTRGSG